jgi:hypothetical protein
VGFVTIEAVRRAYTPELKAEAVALYRGGRSLEEVGDDFGVSAAVVKTWVLQDDMNFAGQARPAAAATQPVSESSAPLSPPALPLPVRRCMVCGRGPALKVTMRSVTGIIIAFRTRRIDGVFCRDCGTAMARQTLNRTLITGWWGLFGAWIATLIFAVVDAIALGRFRRLPAPVGEPKAQPLKPGRSLFQRVGIYMAAVIVAGPFALGVALGTLETASRFVGKCVAFETDKIVPAECTQAHDGRVVSTATHKAYCPDMADVTMQLKADRKNLLCIDLDQ